MLTRARAGTVLIALVLGTVGLAPPASADDYSVAVSSAPGVIFEDCSDHPFTYSVAPPADAYSWSIELTIQAPDGTAAGSVYVGRSSPATGVATESVCTDYYGPGTYSVAGVYEVVQPDGALYTKTVRTPVTPFTFDLRLPYATVAAKPSDKSPRVGQRVKVHVKLTDERPSGGYFPTADAPVTLQRLKGSKWVAIHGTKEYTTTSGKAVLKFRSAWKGKTRFRVRANAGFIGKVDSSTFTLRSKR